MIAPPVPTTSVQSNGDSDSDSDWDDDDDDYGAKKINIRIKPIAQVSPSKISASVDELRASVGTWKSLANINLVKPNSRRHHQSTAQLNDVTATLKAFNGVSISDEQSTKLPVAFAIQECLNARLIRNQDNNDSRIKLIGRVKIAVPQKIVNMNLSTPEQRNLEVTFVTSIPWDKVKLNEEIICESLDDQGRAQPFLSSHSTKTLLIDMNAIQLYAKKQYQKQTDTKYFILPELLQYTIGSQEKEVLLGLNNASINLNPINAMAHWLCDLTITKVRVDIRSLQETLEGCGLSTNDIKNLKISFHVNGGVVSCQSKPTANWNPIDSKLTWSFSNLTELVEKSTLMGVTSCLARFDLNDGPSTASDISLQFSIAGKTISGSHLILNDTKNFRLATQKYEVRTGSFKCVPPNF